MICIEDIAHALSLICRWNGHCTHFYSVAQHSLHCAEVAKDRGLSILEQFEALMHDATEAYLGDMTTFLKRLLPRYKEIENSVDVVIRKKYGLPSEMSPVIKEIDLEVLGLEWDYFLSRLEWDNIPTHAEVKGSFIQKFKELSGNI